MVFYDLEMNTLEDAYINIAKAEERLHNQNQADPESLLNNPNNKELEF